MKILTRPVLQVDTIEVPIYRPPSLLRELGRRLDRMFGGNPPDEKPTRKMYVAGRHSWAEGKMVIEPGDGVILGKKIAEFTQDDVTYQGIIPLCHLEDGTTSFIFDHAMVKIPKEMA